MRRCGRARVSASSASAFGVFNHEQKSFPGAFTFIASIAVSTTFAQGPGAQPKPQTPPVQTSAAAVPVSKIAVIFSEEFQDPKAGIARFATTLRKLNGEFADRQKKADDMAVRIKATSGRDNQLATASREGDSHCAANNSG